MMEKLQENLKKEKGILRRFDKRDIMFSSMHVQEILRPYSPQDIDDAKNRHFPEWWTCSPVLPVEVQAKYFVRTATPRDYLLARRAQPDFVRAEFTYTGSRLALVAESCREVAARLVHTGGTRGERVFLGSFGLTAVALAAGAATDNLNLRSLLALQIAFAFGAVSGARSMRREAAAGVRNAITY